MQTMEFSQVFPSQKTPKMVSLRFTHSNMEHELVAVLLVFKQIKGMINKTLKSQKGSGTGYNIAGANKSFEGFIFYTIQNSKSGIGVGTPEAE